MAVLIEGISVVIRADRLLDKFVGSWDGFKQIVPNSTLCADGEIARVGFMSPLDCRDFIGQLEDCGLTYLGEESAADIVVVDQQKGAMVPCNWIEV